MIPSIRSRITIGLLSTTLFSLLLLGGLFLVFLRGYTRNLSRDYLEQKAVQLLEEFRRQRDNANDPNLSTLDNQILRRLLSREQEQSQLQFRILDESGQVTDSILFQRNSGRPTMPLHDFLFDQLGPAMHRSRNSSDQPLGSNPTRSDGSRLVVPLSPLPGSPALELLSETTFLDRIQKDALVGYSAAAGLSLLLASIMALVITRNIANPLLSLKTRVEEFSLKTSPHEDPPNPGTAFILKNPGSREVEQLSIGFSAMADGLAQKYRELQQERDSLKYFLADASHELRTPLTAGLAFTELLRKELMNYSTHTSSGDSQELLSDLENQLFRMRGIVENLLTLSRLDAGISPIPKEPFDLLHTITTVQHEFTATHSKIGPEDISSQVSALPDLEPWGNPQIITQLLTILLDNAYRYGAPPVQISAWYDPQAGAVMIQVLDHGPGVEPGEEEKITQRFFRGAAGTASNQGLGLGLSIARSLTQSMGGDLLVNPHTNTTGLCIRFLFPTQPRP